MYMHHDSSPDLSAPCVCTALRKAVRTLDRLYDARIARHGITTTQFALLRTIHRAGEIVLSQLAARMVMDRTSLYRTLRPMEAAGWVGIADAPRGRARLARLTPAGEAAMHAAEPDWMAMQADVHSRMGEEDWQAVLAMSARLVALGRADTTIAKQAGKDGTAS